MSQILSQVPRQLLAQQQRLTPQLIQAMDILQLPAMALESRLEAELDANPALELTVPEDDTNYAEPSPEAGPEPEVNEGERQLVVDEKDPREFERLETLVREYDFDDEFGYRGSKSRGRIEEEGDQKLDAMANASARGESLQEYLLSQWTMLDLDEDTRRIGVRIIESLLDTGRLETPLDQIAAALTPRPTSEQVDQALARVQSLDPPGIAARSLQECLILQLEALPGDHALAIQIVDEQFESLQKNRLPQVARSLGVEMTELQEAISQLSRLSMHPGLKVVERRAPIVIPDVIVEFNERENRYDVRLARTNLREVRVSPEFREALEKARHDPQTRDFIKDKIAAANAIIDAIRYRRERLLDVARAVVESQRDFLDYGEQHLKVLRMSELAERFGCDPSTISRTVDEKWMQTPRGIYPLRRFFTGGTESQDGEMVGWDSIKAKVQEIIAGEDKKEPLSDDEIIEKLRAAGIDIKRRTVAKYRAQLNIPAARQRRQY